MSGVPAATLRIVPYNPMSGVPAATLKIVLQAQTDIPPCQQDLRLDGAPLGDGGALLASLPAGRVLTLQQGTLGLPDTAGTGPSTSAARWVPYSATLPHSHTGWHRSVFCLALGAGLSPIRSASTIVFGIYLLLGLLGCRMIGGGKGPGMSTV